MLFVNNCAVLNQRILFPKNFKSSDVLKTVDDIASAKLCRIKPFDYIINSAKIMAHLK